MSLAPYYQSERVTLYCGDCREILAELPKASVDLIVSDPPYGVRWISGRRHVEFGKIAGDESSDVAIKGLSCALPSLRNGRHVYYFGRYDLSDLPLTKSVELIWDKGLFNSGDLSIPWGSQHEYIQFAPHYKSKRNRADGYGLGAARLRRGSVLKYQRKNSRGVASHPTEKPVELLRELIESSSTFGETVLDMFAGSGSTLVAAVLEGRRAIGIELEERYCEIAAKRIQAAESQYALFEPAEGVA